MPCCYQPQKKRIETLQRKLYQKAKQEPDFRFYSLYDKICRIDILQHSYDRVEANRGGPGIDGITFQQVSREGEGKFLIKLKKELEDKTYKADPVKRVMIPKSNGGERPLGIPTIRDRVVQMATKLILEPIFEADFSDRSYGFRPGRSAHHTLDDIDGTLKRGHTQVVDADLSKYFDSISHSNLMKVVSERIADKAVLSLIKMWLKAPIIQVEKDGRKSNVGGGGRNQKGTPQGGVISPLLANLYLHIFDRIWDRHEFDRKLNARLIRYADDFVILCAAGAEGPLEIAKKVIERLDLSLNEEKTKTVDSTTGKFAFLGFEIQMMKGRRSGRLYPNTKPSKKAVSNIMTQVTELTNRYQTGKPIQEVIAEVNQKVRGWVGYFHYGNCSQSLNRVKEHVEERVRTHLRIRHKLRCRGTGYKRVSKQEVVRSIRVIQSSYNGRMAAIAHALGEEHRKAVYVSSVRTV